MVNRFTNYFKDQLTAIKYSMYWANNTHKLIIIIDDYMILYYYN